MWFPSPLVLYYTNRFTALKVVKKQARKTEAIEGLKVAYMLLRKEPGQRHVEHLKAKMWMFQW